MFLERGIVFHVTVQKWNNLEVAKVLWCGHDIGWLQENRESKRTENEKIRKLNMNVDHGLGYLWMNNSAGVERNTMSQGSTFLSERAAVLSQQWRDEVEFWAAPVSVEEDFDMNGLWKNSERTLKRTKTLT